MDLDTGGGNNAMTMGITIWAILSMGFLKARGNSTMLIGPSIKAISNRDIAVGMGIGRVSMEIGAMRVGIF